MTRARLNGNLKYIALITLILSVIGSLIGLSWNASSVCSRLESNEAADSEVHPIARENHDDIIEIKADVAYTRKAVERIEKKLD